MFWARGEVAFGVATPFRRSLPPKTMLLNFGVRVEGTCRRETQRETGRHGKTLRKILENICAAGRKPITKRVTEPVSLSGC